MLQTLKHHSPAEAAAILASLTLSLSPEVEERVAVPLDEQLRDRLLTEIYKKLHIGSAAHSESEKARLYRLLNREMSHAAVPIAHFDEIKQRVGQRGDLRSDLYQISIPNNVRVKAKERSTTIPEIKDVLEHPDGVEHLLPEQFGVNGDAVSLYYAEGETVKTGEIYFLLVLTIRTGYKQTVRDVVRFYESDVPIQDKTPLALLRAFVEKYGTVQQVGNRKEKLVLYEVIPIVGDLTDIVRGSFDQSSKEMILSTTVVRKSEHEIEVALAYTIMERQYLADLQKHK